MSTGGNSRAFWNGLEGYLRVVQERLAAASAEVVQAGLVDTAGGAAEAGALFARSDLDLIVCHVATYATSSQVLPVVQRAKVPDLRIGDAEADAAVSHHRVGLVQAGGALFEFLHRDVERVGQFLRASRARAGRTRGAADRACGS